MRNAAEDLATVINSYQHENVDESEYGIWEVRGEDPNCDWGGSHVMPLLGYYEGVWVTVAKHAITLERFWQWGSGGSITKAPDTITSAKVIGRRATREHTLDEVLHTPEAFVVDNFERIETKEEMVDLLKGFLDFIH